MFGNQVRKKGEYLSGTKCDNLSELSTLANLTTVTINAWAAEDISVLYGLPNLETVHYVYNP